jgi:hypothetical protein
MTLPYKQKPWEEFLLVSKKEKSTSSFHTDYCRDGKKYSTTEIFGHDIALIITQILHSVGFSQRATELVQGIHEHSLLDRK